MEREALRGSIKETAEVAGVEGAEVLLRMDAAGGIGEIPAQ